MNNLVPAGTAARGRRPVSIDPQTVRERVRERVKELQHGRRRAGEDELTARLVERLSEDDEVLQIAARFVVRIVLHENEARTRRQASAPTSQASHPAEVKTQAKAVAEKVRAICVLDTVLPGGKLLRYATGAEVAELGAGYARLAEKVPANALVGEVLCEQDAAALLMGVVK